jgi:hypothetical protein
MGADRVDMVFIDLGVGKRADDAEDGVRRALDAAAAVSRERTVHFVCMNWAGVGDLAATAKEAGQRLLDVVVWMKSEPSQGAMYRDQYEPIGVLEIGSSEPLCETQERRARHGRSNVWRYPSATSLPLTFSEALRRSARLVPVALVADAIKTARAATTLFLIRFAAPGPRSWPRRGSGGTRAAPSGNRCSSTSRSVGGRRRRVGMHSTRRAACRSIQSRRGAVANTMDGNDERDKSIGEGSPQGAEQKVPDKAIRDARGGIPRWPRPASEGISIQAGPERQSEGRQKEAAVNCDRCQSDVGKGAQCVFEG